MKALLTAKVGMFLVVSSVLAAWMLPAAGPVQAHNLSNPSCSSLPNNAFFTTLAALNASSTTATLTTKKGTGESGSGNINYYYGKITVPALTAGELDVTDNGAGPSEAFLCRGSSKIAESLMSYTSQHIRAEGDATAATRAAAEATTDAAKGDPPPSDVRAAETALGRAKDALTTVATALTAAANARSGAAAAAATAAATAATTAATAAENARVVADGVADNSSSTISERQGALTAAATALTAAASALTAAAGAHDGHMGFDINALISSGDEEYVVVVAANAAPTLGIDFEGVMSTDAIAPDGGSFTLNNQELIHTLVTTANTPGLLTVRTTGSAVDTVGSLYQQGSSTKIQEDKNSGTGNNFQIISPVAAGTTYEIHVEGQTRDERGDYDLKVEFRVAVNLVTSSPPNYADTDRSDVVLEPRRADYFFFTVPASTYRFLTVETLKHDDLTRETNTKGTFFGQVGQIATDNDNGVDSNFRIHAPISPGNYIVKVEGQTSSTEGKYRLRASSQVSTTRGSAPDAVTDPAADTIAAPTPGMPADVDPYSINVTKAGTLQVKTTGNIDTVGILYGPDGRQITTDDNSGTGNNFRITQHVEVGQYIVTVEGQTRTTTGTYTLRVDFIEGTHLDSGARVAELEDEVERLEGRLARCRAPVSTDAKGVLGNPSNGGVRSGIGLISGWVCAANAVQIQIDDAQRRRVTLNAAYGTSRPDTAGQCQNGSTNTGFGMTYNFNRLAEGRYTIRAMADGRQIGSAATFEVVHLSEFAATDDNRFLQDLEGECSASDFPADGQTTMLEWEQGLQNFVITDVQ